MEELETPVEETPEPEEKVEGGLEAPVEAGETPVA